MEDVNGIRITHTVELSHGLIDSKGRELGCQLIFADGRGFIRQTRGGEPYGAGGRWVFGSAVQVESTLRRKALESRKRYECQRGFTRMV